MLEKGTVGASFTVTPVTISLSGVEMVAYIGTKDSTLWLNALYVNNISIRNTDPLFAIISAEITDGHLTIK